MTADDDDYEKIDRRKFRAMKVSNTIKPGETLAFVCPKCGALQSRFADDGTDTLEVCEEEYAIRLGCSFCDYADRLDEWHKVLKE
jgi:uncharacterized protein YlaI